MTFTRSVKNVARVKIEYRFVKKTNKMEIEIKQKVKHEVAYLQVRAGVRYWEDAIVDGVEDEKGDLIPCREVNDWCPLIDLNDGQIINWEKGKTADIHYKVCDDGEYHILDSLKNKIVSTEGYVLDCLAINKSGYGDYIIMQVDNEGFIKDFKFTQEDIEQFETED